jgi:hypothetical protein
VLQSRAEYRVLSVGYMQSDLATYCVARTMKQCHSRSSSSNRHVSQSYVNQIPRVPVSRKVSNDPLHITSHLKGTKGEKSDFLQNWETIILCITRENQDYLLHAKTLSNERGKRVTM